MGFFPGYYCGEKSHLVVSLCFGDKMQIDHEGSYSNCKTWIRRMARNGRPTHFYYVVTNSCRAVERFKRQYDIRKT